MCVAIDTCKHNNNNILSQTTGMTGLYLPPVICNLLICKGNDRATGTTGVLGIRKTTLIKKMDIVRFPDLKNLSYIFL